MKKFIYIGLGIIAALIAAIILIPLKKGASSIQDYWKELLKEKFPPKDDKGRPIYDFAHTAIKGTLPKGSSYIRFWTYGYTHSDSPFMNEIANLPTSGSGRPVQAGYWLDTITTEKEFHPKGDILTAPFRTKDGEIITKEIVQIDEKDSYSFALVEELKNIEYYKGSTTICT